MWKTNASSAKSQTPSKSFFRLPSFLLCAAMWSCVPVQDSTASTTKPISQIQDPNRFELKDTASIAEHPMTQASSDFDTPMIVLLIAAERIFLEREFDSNQELVLEGIAFLKSRWNDIIRGVRPHQIAGDLILFVNLNSNKNLSDNQKQLLRATAVSIFKKISQRYHDQNSPNLNDDLKDLVAVLQSLPLDSLNQASTHITSFTIGEFLEDYETSLRPLLEAGIPQFQFQHLCRDLIHSQLPFALTH